MPRPFILAITGATNAGKSYFRNEFMKLAIHHKLNVEFLSTDEFYKDLSHLTMEERTKVNYDHPDSIDSFEFVKALKSLAEGKTTIVPVYNFSIHNRDEKTREIIPQDVIIVEGIFSMVYADIVQYYNLTVFIDLERDLRLIRRINRDMQERGRTLDSVIDQFTTTVRPTQKSFVEEDVNKADIIVKGDRDHTRVIEMIISYIKSQA